jgi:flagellar biosynthesis protein
MSMTAAEIERVAREHGVTLHEDADLVEALAQLDCSRTIPRELYAVAAEVLAFVHQADALAKAGSSP